VWSGNLTNQKLRCPLCSSSPSTGTDSECSADNYWNCFRFCCILCHISRAEKRMKSAAGKIRQDIKWQIKWLCLSVMLLGTKHSISSNPLFPEVPDIATFTVSSFSAV
jgi:hypothetical protein